MDPGEQSTGTRDEQYNLVSVLYHALHGAENCEVYAVDAEAAGDERLSTFFREAQAAQVETAERAKELLGISSDVALRGASPASAGDVGAGGAMVQSEVAVGGATGGNELSPDIPTEEIPLTSNVPPGTPRNATEREVLPRSSPSAEDVPTRSVDDLPDEPPDIRTENAPRRTAPEPPPDTQREPPPPGPPPDANPPA